MEKRWNRDAGGRGEGKVRKYPFQVQEMKSNPTTLNRTRFALHCICFPFSACQPRGRERGQTCGGDVDAERGEEGQRNRSQMEGGKVKNEEIGEMGRGGAGEE